MKARKWTSSDKVACIMRFSYDAIMEKTWGLNVDYDDYRDLHRSWSMKDDIDTPLAILQSEVRDAI